MLTPGTAKRDPAPLKHFKLARPYFKLLIYSTLHVYSTTRFRKKAGHWLLLLSPIPSCPSFRPSLRIRGVSLNLFLFFPLFLMFLSIIFKSNKGQNTSMTPTWTLASWNKSILWSVILLFITNFIKERASFKNWVPMKGRCLLTLTLTLNETAPKIKNALYTTGCRMLSPGTAKRDPAPFKHFKLIWHL